MLSVETCLLQVIGFGMRGGPQNGRRAALSADIENQGSSVLEDNKEKDELLRQVEARDLIDFGMIPVSRPVLLSLRANPFLL